MKRMLMILVPACLILSSCGLLNMALNGGTGVVANTVASGMATITPNPQHLQAQEDRGTGLYGYLNQYGNWAIAPTFAYAKDFNRDLGIAAVELQGGRWGAIDVYGQTVIQFNFRSSFDVESAMNSIIKGRYQGIDLWEMQDSASGLYGYLDFYGNWYIAPQYKYTTDMWSEGYAVVQFMDEKWGAIDRTNRIVVQPNFNSRYDAESALRNLLRR